MSAKRKTFDIFTELSLEPTLNDVQREYGAILTMGRKEALERIFSNYSEEVDAFNDEKIQKDGKLDLHKQCACLCGGILKSGILKPNMYLPEAQRQRFYPNEVLAFASTTLLIKMNIVNECESLVSNEMIALIERILPYYPKEITDRHDYLSNTLCYLHLVSNNTSGIFSYDRFAYSTIFYHLEYENRAYINEYVHNVFNMTLFQRESITDAI